MKTQIVRIGNSRCVRIPTPLLIQTGLQDEVEIIAEHDSLVIRPARRRVGWATAFREMTERGDDALIGGVSPTQSPWDEDVWAWR